MNYYDEEIEVNKSADGTVLPKVSPRRLSEKIKPKIATLPANDFKKVVSKGHEGSDISATESEEESFSEHKPGDRKSSITAEKWKDFDVPSEVKEVFSYILKYTPQHIEPEYYLCPFIPDYVPAVGDVDAFLKVESPNLSQNSRRGELLEHLSQMGVSYLDEPSGHQSDPSVLSIKMRSVLTGGGKHSANIKIPIAKNSKDIDKWINEVEQFHVGQTIVDIHSSKDVQTLLTDWPISFEKVIQELEAKAGGLQEESLKDYVKSVCQMFGIEIVEETQLQYIIAIKTLFSMYLSVNNSSFE